MSQHTYVGTVEGEQAPALLTRVARAYTRKLERAAAWRLRHGKDHRALKQFLQDEHACSRRQADSLVYDLEGRITAWEEGAKYRLERLAERIARSEEKRAELDGKLAALQARTAKPARLARDAETEARLRRAIAGKDAALDRCRIKKARLEKDLARNRPEILVGGKAFFKKQFELAANGFADHDAWREAWRRRRTGQFFLLGSGEEKDGNQEAVLDRSGEVWSLRLSLHRDLAGQADGPAVRNRRTGAVERVRYAALRVRFDARARGLIERALDQGRALSWRFLRGEDGVWRAAVSFDRPPAPSVVAPDAHHAWLGHGVLGIDLNPDRVACAHLDRHGNPAGGFDLPLALYRKSRAQSDAILGDVAAAIVAYARDHGLPIVCERLDFAKKKAALKHEPKWRRRMLSAFVHARFFAVLERRAESEGVPLLRVNPAFSSVIGQAKLAGYGLDRHRAAAVAIGRRGMLRRKAVAGIAAEEARRAKDRAAHRALNARRPKEAKTKFAARKRGFHAGLGERLRSRGTGDRPGGLVSRAGCRHLSVWASWSAFARQGREGGAAVRAAGRPAAAAPPATTAPVGRREKAAAAGARRSRPSRASPARAGMGTAASGAGRHVRPASGPIPCGTGPGREPATPAG